MSFRSGRSFARVAYSTAIPAAALVLLVACSGDLPNAPTPVAPLLIPLPCDPMTDPMCEPQPPTTPPPWMYFAPRGDFLYDVPSYITPSHCYADLNPTVSAYRDYDKDWLADECELELAKAFAPLLHFSNPDPCPGGEPAWAAKYFNIPKIVRIAYLPAYYDDCGLPQLGQGGGHAGDAEMIMIEVIFNAATAGWQLNQMWLSAHQGAIGERSAWVLPAQAQYTQRYLGHPSVWVAWRKHANYKSFETCTKPLIDTERCTVGGDRLRFPVQPGRNLGSRHQYILDCTTSTGRFAGNGIQECFWSGRVFSISIGGLTMTGAIFGGWHANNDLYGGQPGPYNDLLQSQFFERRCGTGLYHSGFYACLNGPIDAGPGPSPPGQPRPPLPPPTPPPPSECDPYVLICQEPLGVERPVASPII